MNDTCLVFENDGELDFRAISLFGCSVKESTNPIGFFGTGLKFALAVLIRHGQHVHIQSGLRCSDVSARKESIRGKDFQCAFMGDEHLGFTTELGKTWEPWMAYRELYCNAKDEPGCRIHQSKCPPLPTAGKTRVVVSGDLLIDIHRKRDEFVLESAPDFKMGDIEVRHRPSQFFFYKGIRVGQYQTPSLYTYNATGPVELTEDRTVKCLQTQQYAIARAWMQYGPKHELEQVLTAGNNKVEYFLDFHGWGIEPSEAFLSAVGEAQLNSLSRVNHSALKLWREKTGQILTPRTVPTTRVQGMLIAKAVEASKRIGFDVDRYPILIAESLGEVGVLAMADCHGKRILLSQKLIEEGGVKMVARALIEEFIHIAHGLKDETREMQNFLFSKMISLAEELNGEPL